MTGTTTMKTNRVIGTVVIAAVLGFVGLNLAAPVIGNAYNMSKMDERFWGTSDAERAYIREQNFEVVCKTWNEQNLWGKYVTYRERTWCKDYVDRL